MTLAAVLSPYLPINGLTGVGLNDGALYIGEDGKDPQTYPQACYWDAAGTIPAAQPVQVLGGYPMRLGTPTRLYTGDTYSMRVRDASGAQVFYEAHCVPAANAPNPVTELASLGVFPTRAAAIAANISAALQATGIRLLGYTSAGDGGAALYRSRLANPGHAGAFQSADGAWWEIATFPLTLEMFGAVGDGATDDGAAINNASAAAVTMGRPELCGTAGKVYRTTVALYPRQNLLWDFRKSAVSCGLGISIFNDQSYNTQQLIGAVVGDVAAGQSTFPLTSVVGLAVGDWVGLRLGNNAYDVTEPRYAFAAKVTSIAGAAVTVDWSTPYNIALGAAAANNKALYKLQGDNPINVIFRDLELRGDQVSPGVESGIRLNWGVNIVLENVTANLGGTGDMGAGLAVLQFCRAVRIKNPVIGSNRNTRNQASLGRALSFSNCINVAVEDLVARNLQGTTVLSESYCEDIKLVRPFVSVRTAVARAGYATFGATQNSELLFEDLSITVDGAITQTLDSGGTPNKVRYRGVFKWRGAMPLGLLLGEQAECVIDFDDGANNCIVDFTMSMQQSVQIPATPNLTNNAYFLGPIVAAQAFCSAGVVLAGVLAFYLGYETNNGDQYSPSLARGLVKGIALTGLNSGFGNNNGGFSRLTGRGKLLVNTDATVQPAGAFVGLSAKIAKVVSVNGAPVLGNTGSFAASDAQMAQILKGVSP